MQSSVLQWQPTREGYLKFLVESKEVYEVLEQIVQQAHKPECESAASSQCKIPQLLMPKHMLYISGTVLHMRS